MSIKSHRARVVPVSAEARLNCTNALKRLCASEAASERLAGQLVEVVQNCAYCECERPAWPTEAKVRRELETAFNLVRATQEALLKLSGPGLFLAENAVGAGYYSSMGGLSRIECGLEEAIQQTPEVITGKKGHIRLMLRSAAMRWRMATGEWPALTNSTTDGVASTPFLKILRDLLKEATPAGRDVPKISDHMFRRALTDAQQFYAQRNGDA